jgi:nitrogen fixation protein NifB
MKEKDVETTKTEGGAPHSLTASQSHGLSADRHPCFNHGAAGTYARIHLPIAPACNIQCNYCNRKCDCVNESRPGVTSAVLSPEEAVCYLGRVKEKAPHLAVAGIAGPAIRSPIPS